MKITNQLLSGEFVKLTLSDASSPARASKIIVRPIEIKGDRKIQIEEFIGPQAFHKNMDIPNAAQYLSHIAKNFHHINLAKGKANLSHDQTKNRIFQDGNVIPPLVKLGIMNDAGRVYKDKMDKFIQINHFLSILSGSIKQLPNDKTLEIVDFCSGKSYLTFIVSYFFTHILKRKVNIVGIDSKTDVIENCQLIARDAACDNIKLIADDINNFNPNTNIDIALSLHACDVATDIVLKKAVSVGASLILSVPCCHKEVAKQIKNEQMDFMLKYGIIRERFSALLTDALRANWLETKGYKVDIIEFVDYSNSPKNIMLRAVRTNRKSNMNLNKITADFNIRPNICENMDC
jgi:hypothetical protein